MMSAIYAGQVRHRRLLPKAHDFTYQMYMMYLDLDELTDVFPRYSGFAYQGKAPFVFKREDYLRPTNISLKQAVSTLLEQHLGRPVTGRVFILTNLRCFGVCFNPVSFYYCYDAHGELDAIIAEITNTPWLERHCYVLDQKATEQHEFAKAFHISPFMPMDMHYRWRFAEPDNKLQVNMINYNNNGQQVFSAHLNLEKKAINRANLWRLGLRHPNMSLKVIAGIYWQALKLKLKAVPFYSHPKEPSS